MPLFVQSSVAQPPQTNAAFSDVRLWPTRNLRPAHGMAWERRKRKCELKNIPGNFIAHCNGEIAAHIRRKVNQIACVENIRTIDIEKLNFAPLEYKMLMLSCEKSIYTFNLRCAQTNFLVFNRVVCCTRVWSCDNFRLWYGV